MKLARILTIVAAPLLLASCLFTPGKFVSTLDIKADRSFTFTYAGEVILIDPQDAFAKGMAEGMQSGSDPTSTTDSDPDMDPEDMDMNASEDAAPAPSAPAAPQPETQAQIAKRKAMAELLAKEIGYRSVEYLGNDKFRVDYAITGRLDRSFVYPFNVDAKSFFPWIAIEVRRDNTARIMALAFGDSDQAMGSMPGANEPAGKQPTTREGTFTLTTDAALVMQNNEEGVAAGPGTKIVWKITPATTAVPTAVVRFAR
ncbi:MAG TPA: hypothetical protein VIT45_17110 [Allosphingosinicella sp.]